MTWRCARQNRKTGWLYTAILLTIPVVLFIMQRSGGYLAGTSVDWISQHTVFPDYFRRLFYETGSLFPQLAAEPGGGQNIYNFAYYGLFNPLYWLSYLLPFVKMSTYIQFLSLAQQMADGVLCYLWLKEHYEKRYSFFAAAVLLLSLPVTYHSSSQLMFVNYMPFLLLAFIGYDRYCRTSKYGLLTGSVTLMILTSFYFALGGLAALTVYALSGFTKKQASTVRTLAAAFWRQLYPAVLGGFLSMFYLMPVYCAMRAGRSGSAATSAAELFIPDASLYKFVYSPYGLGLTAAAAITVCTAVFYKKCREKWLAVFLIAACSFPVFSWLLNGGLYIRDKALIPFLPVVCQLAASFLQRVGQKELPAKQAACGYALAAAALYLGSREISGNRKELLYLDLALCGLALLLSLNVWKNLFCLWAAGVMAFACVAQTQLVSSMRVREAYMQVLENPDTGKAVRGLLKDQKELCRIEARRDYKYNKDSQNRVLAAGQNLTTCYSSVTNSDYQSFRRDIGLSKASRNSLMQDASDNPVFLRFMGVRYLVGHTDIAGYKKTEAGGRANSVNGTNAAAQTNIYENEAAAPLFYLTEQTISERQFRKLSWPEKQLSLLEHAAVGKQEGNVSAHTEERGIRLNSINEPGEGDRFIWRDDKLCVASDKDVKKVVRLDQASSRDEYLFLSFSIKNNKENEDVSITVNGQKNKLSGKKRVYYNKNEVFHYTCAVPEGTCAVTVEFGAGQYEISNISCSSGTEDRQKNQSLYQTRLDLRLTESRDGYKGTFDARSDSWLVTSIPYDNGFQICVDGQETDARKVNLAFLGARITKGRHSIEIKYRAQGRTAGIAVSAITVMVLIADNVRRRKYKLRREDSL